MVDRRLGWVEERNPTRDLQRGSLGFALGGCTPEPGRVASSTQPTQATQVFEQLGARTGASLLRPVAPGLNPPLSQR